MFIFSKPKQTILNVMFSLAIVSLIISILAVSIVILWKFNPTVINKVDILIPDTYGQEIRKLYSNAKNSQDTIEKIKYFLELEKKLKKITRLHKFYNYKTEAIIYLINYNLERKNYLLAMKYANEWKNKYEFDLNAKFYFAKILNLIDNNKAIKYYANLYIKYGDIIEVAQNYIIFLLENNNLSKALEIEKQLNLNSILEVDFKMYYINKKRNNFSENYSFALNNIVKDKSNYEVTTNKNLVNIKKIRLDMDGLPIGLIVKNISLSFYINDKKIVIKNISNSSDAIKDKNKYLIVGNDPYFIFDLPSEVFNNKINNINFNLTIEKTFNKTSKKILNDPEWQIFYSLTQHFTENESQKLLLRKNINNDNYTGNVNAINKTTKYIRIDFPSIKDLIIKQLTLNINNIKQDININSLNNINIHDQKLKILGKDPYVIIELNNTIDIEDVVVGVKL